MKTYRLPEDFFSIVSDCPPDHKWFVNQYYSRIELKRANEKGEGCHGELPETLDIVYVSKSGARELATLRSYPKS